MPSHENDTLFLYYHELDTVTGLSLLSHAHKYARGPAASSISKTNNELSKCACHSLRDYLRFHLFPVTGSEHSGGFYLFHLVCCPSSSATPISLLESESRVIWLLYAVYIQRHASLFKKHFEQRREKIVFPTRFMELFVLFSLELVSST